MSTLADDYRHLPPLLTPKEVAQILRISVDCVYQRKWRGALAGVVSNGAQRGFLVRKAELLSSLEQRRAPSPTGGG